LPRGRLPAGELRLGLRPEAVHVAKGDATTKSKVDLVERLGERTLVYAHLADGQQIIAEDEPYSRVRLGDQVLLAIDGASAHVFGADGIAYHRTEA
jgi:multiple sugar transport system ATP-binding protein